MKVIKIILSIIVAIIVVALVTALFVKKDYAIEKTIEINQSDSVVFNFVKYVKNQDSFAVWNNIDPKMKKSYRGTDGKVGFAYAWDSDNKNVGKGEQEILHIDEGKKLLTVLRFKVPFESADTAYIVTDSIAPKSTKVTWGFYGKFPYPMNLMQLFYNMDDMVGGDLDKGLANLKTHLDK